ncbi:proteasome subunit beta type-2-like protein [Leptotrombidium deliense]|uniref:Proteasome subunit beta n=1 Tax=Leptotrombidium deliense TaxID=299467 RepID=A0A443S5N5_9ACAR|nr:proteasome subunit beta type-2-like protein [Leptotrombidium deliense]
MEVLIGVTFKDFALLAADKMAAFSVISMKNDENKLYKLSDTLMMAVCGEPGDTKQFAEFIEKNIQLYKMRNGFELPPKSAATFIQRNMADYLRSRSPYTCNILLAGYDTENGPELYLIDYLATMTKLPYGIHGYGSMFALGFFDRYYRYDMSVEEALDLLKRCINEIQKRLIVSLPVFKVSIIHKDHIKEMDDVKVDTKALGLSE